MLRLLFIIVMIFYVAGNAFADTRLAEGQGRDEVLGNCTICHSEALILNNRMSRQRWDETITWMQEKQGLWELEPEMRKTILDYLAKHQGISDRPAGSGTMYRHHYPVNPLAKEK